MKIKSTAAIMIILLLLITSTTVFRLSRSSPDLEVTIKTDKQIYWPNETITIYGNLTLNDGFFPYGLVAIEVDKPDGTPLTIRTTDTGRPILEPELEIKSVEPCNAQGEPKTSFEKNSFAFFKVTIENYVFETKQVLAVINLIDNASCIIDSSYALLTVPKESYTTFLMSVLIKNDAAVGMAKVYASALTDFPKNNGTAYCLEKSAKIEIIGAGPTKNQPEIVGTTEGWGRYNLTFRLAPSTPPGQFQIHSTSLLYYEIAHASTTINVLAHDISIKHVSVSNIRFLPTGTLETNVTLKNEGSFTETFTISFSYFDVTGHNNLIREETLTLDANSKTIKSFEWTTPSGVWAFLIKIEVYPVSGEVDVFDNTYQFYIYSIPTVDGAHSSWHSLK